MRILEVITSLERGGAQLSVAAITAGLRARGLDVHLAFSSAGGSRPGSHHDLHAELVRRGVPVHDVPAMRRGVSLLDALAVAELERLVARLAPAIVHTHASKAGLLGRIAAVRARVPRVVHTVRGWPWHGRSEPARRLFVGIERYAGRITDHFVAVAEAMVASGLAHGVGTRDRYSVIRSGIELARFRMPRDRVAIRARLGLGDAHVVGTVTRLDRAKAPLDFVAVAARLARRFPHVRFLVVGDGTARADFSRAIGDLRSRFVLVGERDDVPELLAAMDTFVLTSRWEGMPRVVVEAAESRVPIVTTDVGGVRELVEHERSGIVCRPGAIDELAASVARLIIDPALAGRLAASCRVPRDFELEGVINRHVELYEAMSRDHDAR